ncbi:MAG: non-hydrolyzing UDP-N-acetylglucosamine 2-epimerase [Verrucomicrobium sp.]|nr:UDP-N-acetylglucosamine 2-epimerase (non-hydrolyzing) [Verrucomicrobium sp.]
MFGTRPELIKLGPVIRELNRAGLGTCVINTGQHSDLLTPLLAHFGVRPDYDLATMHPGQSLNALGARILAGVDEILLKEKPDVVLVQGDTSTALMGAMAAFNRKIDIGHVEAGLRSGNPLNPFPEEMNRQMISRMAKYHFAATENNRRTLLMEGTPDQQIYLTGNPVVDALRQTLALSRPRPELTQILDQVGDRKFVLVTTHRRENFGQTMRGHMRAIRRFASAHPELCVVFPVHPNPNVREAAMAELAGHNGILLTSPVGYADFVHLLSHAWLIVSDSGGIQEEVTALGKPMLVLRNNTERPEAVEAGAARLVGESPLQLERMLEEAVTDLEWFVRASRCHSVFGDGFSARHIVNILNRGLALEAMPQRLAA